MSPSRSKNTELPPKTAGSAHKIKAGSGQQVGSYVLDDLHALLQANHMRVMDLFRKWDTDGSGSIQKKELRKAIAALGHNEPETGIDELFDSIDAGGNGAIEFKEFHRAIQRGRTSAPAAPEDRWLSHTSSKDGRAYYYNPALNVTTWEKPPNWKKQDDRFHRWKAFEAPDGGGTYYFNVETQESTWTRPRDEPIEYSPWYVGDAEKLDPSEQPSLMLATLNFFNPAAEERLKREAQAAALAAEKTAAAEAYATAKRNGTLPSPPRGTNPYKLARAGADQARAASGARTPHASPLRVAASPPRTPVSQQRKATHAPSTESQRSAGQPARARAAIGDGSRRAGEPSSSSQARRIVEEPHSTADLHALMRQDEHLKHEERKLDFVSVLKELQLVTSSLARLLERRFQDGFGFVPASARQDATKGADEPAPPSSANKRAPADTKPKQAAAAIKNGGGDGDGDLVTAASGHKPEHPVVSPTVSVSV